MTKCLSIGGSVIGGNYESRSGSMEAWSSRSRARSKKLGGERKAETNASTLVGVTSHVTISAKIHCK